MRWVTTVPIFVATSPRDYEILLFFFFAGDGTIQDSERHIELIPKNWTVA